jgi:hypothetical protein
VAAGFLTKLTILFFGFAVLLALLATPERRFLGTRWPWLAFGIGMIGFLPYVVWNALDGWQTLDFYRSYRYLTTGPIAFLANQILLMNPISFPLVIAGVVFYFRKSGARYRVMGWTFVFAYLVLTVVHGKPYFLGPAYPILFAAGAVAFERGSLRPRLTWIKPVYLAALALVGIVLAPVAMPILPPAIFARIYGSQAGMANAAAAQSGAAVLPQNLSDRFGWDTLTATVEQVYDSLTLGEKAQACVLVGNYGEAGALNLLAAPGRLPSVVSGHNNYYLWGPGGCTGKVLIVVGLSRDTIEAARSIYSKVTLAAVRESPYSVPYERNLPVYIFSDPKDPSFDLRGSWHFLKHYD